MWEDTTKVNFVCDVGGSVAQGRHKKCKLCVGGRPFAVGRNKKCKLCLLGGGLYILILDNIVAFFLKIHIYAI